MQKELEVDGIKINYDESGPADGSPVIIMHGWGCNNSTVKFIADSLNDKMHVISVDLPGHGKSDEPLSVWGTFDFAGCMSHLISLLNLKSPALIGHSFGGRTAIAMASTCDYKKIVLVDAAGIKPKRSFNYYRKVYSYKLAKNLVKLLMNKDKAQRKIDKMRNKKGSADYVSSSPMMRAVMSRCVNEDLQKYMPAIKSPTLLIWGENDTATPIQDAKIMEKRIPDAGLVSFPGSGHYSFLDNPIGFRAVIREFFKEELVGSYR